MSDKEKIIDELRILYRDVRLKFEESLNTEDELYWQGKKDGLRIALALINPDGPWQQLNESSPNGISTDREIYREMLESALYNLADALWTIESRDKPHPQSLLNFKKWLRWYYYQAKNGLVKEIKDACYGENEL